MGRRTSYEPGTFCWVHLATPDPDAAKAFYGALLGWEAEDRPAGEGPTYAMLRRDGAAVAGLYEQDDEQRAQGVPAAWTSYVSVRDADAVAGRASGLGGGVLAGPMDVPQGGRMAVIADSEGAALALWQPREHHGAEVVDEPGALSWNDLVTLHVEDAIAFYRELFGWEVEQIPGAPYWVIRGDGAGNGGMTPMTDEQRAAGRPSAWMPYFAVDDLNSALRAVEAAGGPVLVAPIEVPAGRFAVARDPQGAVFGLLAGTLDP